MSVINISLPTTTKNDLNQTLDEDEDINMLEDTEQGPTDANSSNSANKRTTANSVVVVPGELITEDPTWMRGHGTYYLNDKTYSSVAGTILKVNKLLSVIPFKGRYSPETGDHIIGRVVDCGNKRWRLQIGAEHDAVLMLGSVNLPGGVLRRKNESDELQMRFFLKEGDLLNAEVQTVFNDGAASLHTRSLKYGKLRNGNLCVVPSSLIVRAKNHSHDLPGGVSVILGVNGFCWVYKTNYGQLGSSSQNGAGGNLGALEAGIKSATSGGGYKPGAASVSITRLEQESSWDIYSDKNDEISPALKETISRYKNCLLALSHCNIGIDETRLVAAYEISLGYGDVNSLVSDEVKEAIGEQLITAEKMRG
ncbi:unnamed protein product [Ambrosiozyma monospora]|uniref:Unnamed protein product n=1 Tax=Ambrosiozyma monospora TaxID=43982 RepID=A0A9W6Z0H7_AMBMO|nr:unnamed protein product [Ambrosiozyma monospora]